MQPSSSVTLGEPAQSLVKRGYATLAFLSLAHFFIDLYSSALGAFQPILVEKLGLSLSQAGLLGGLLVLSSSTMQPAYGYLADRYQSKLFTALAPAVAGMFISLIGLATSFQMLVVMVLLGGAGIASFHPQGSSKALQGVTENRARMMAIFISSGTLGLAFGPTFFSFIATRLGNENTWIGMIPGILITLLLLWQLPAGGTIKRKSRFNLHGLKAVWRPLSVLYLLVFIRSIVQISFTQFIPLYMNHERGMSLEQSSLALSLYLASGAFGGFIGGHLADRLGGRFVIMLSMIVSVPFICLFFLADGWLSLLGLALGGLTLLFTNPVNVSMGQELAPQHAGTVSALMMGFAWGTAGMIFIPLIGLVADNTSLHHALFATSIFPVLGFFLAMKLPRKHEA